MTSTTTVLCATIIQNTAWYEDPGWFEAGGTIAAVVISLLYGLDIIGWKPKIEVSVSDPRCIRVTPLANNAGRACWIRLKVENLGRATAQNCYGVMMSIIDENGNTLFDKDPMHLRWAGYPQKSRTIEKQYRHDETVIITDAPVSEKYMGGFVPIQIANKQFALLNVFIIREKPETHLPMGIVTYPNCDFGFETSLESNRFYTAVISIFSENLKNPKQVKLKIKYDGKFREDNGKLAGLDAGFV